MYYHFEFTGEGKITGKDDKRDGDRQIFEIKNIPYWFKVGLNAA